MIQNTYDILHTDSTITSQTFNIEMIVSILYTTWWIIISKLLEYHPFITANWSWNTLHDMKSEYTDENEI